MRIGANSKAKARVIQLLARLNIFEILIRAATQRDSIENTSKVLKNVPTSNDIRYHLEKYSDLNSLESDLNTALQSRLPDGIRQGKQKIAIDFNLIPY